MAMSLVTLCLLAACSGPGTAVSLVPDQETVRSGELASMTLEIEGDVDDIIYGGYHFLEKATDDGWQPEWVLFSSVGEGDPSYSPWRKNMAFTLEGYSGEGSLLFKIPDEAVPGDYRVVFEYTDLSVPTDDRNRSVQVTVPMTVEP